MVPDFILNQHNEDTATEFHLLFPAKISYLAMLYPLKAATAL